MLRAENLSFQIGAHRLLCDVHAEFAPGELAVLAGPNGAGKTTLLRCLDGELTPTSGAVSLDGRAMREWHAVQLARRRAVLPQQSTLDFPFSVMDVVLMGRMPHATSEAENRAIANAVMEWCDCAHLSPRAYTSLSGGERQRVQIARVLAQVHSDDLRGRFVLLDEPAAALDLRHQYALMRRLHALCERGLGAVCSMHDLNLAARFADRVLLLDAGRVVADGHPREVLNAELLREVFGIEVRVVEVGGGGVVIAFSTKPC